MAPSKKWICQLILLHYNLPCKSIKIKKIQTDLNLGWLFFFDEKDLTQQLHCLEKCTKLHFDKMLFYDKLLVGVTFCILEKWLHNELWSIGIQFLSFTVLIPLQPLVCNFRSTFCRWTVVVITSSSSARKEIL